MGIQTALSLIFPTQCVCCSAFVDGEGGLCHGCWGDTPFIQGTICDSCGVPLPGETDHETLICDDCLHLVRPWDKGRAALSYAGKGRELVMAFKHGDRTEIAVPAARWMSGVFEPLANGHLVVPVPLHWTRFLKRRYNQSAVLAKSVARTLDLTFAPGALLRSRPTKSLDHEPLANRFDLLDGAIAPHPRYGERMEGEKVLLVDDVMTSGATLAAATEACYAAGADHVDVLTLARVLKSD